MQRVLPPILFLGLLLGVFSLQFVSLDIFHLLHASKVPYGEIAICSTLGLILLVGGRLQFRRANAEIVTFDTPRNLVTTGLYRFSRNPMYLGFALLLLAAALYVNVWQALAAPVAFFLAAHFWYIPYEERAALAAFGTRYEDYRRQVRRWL